MTHVRGNELYHYGVKGMKWGVRKEKSTKRKTKVSNKSENVKKYVIIGAAAVATGLTIYGAVKLSESRSFDRVVKSGRNFYRSANPNEKLQGLNQLVYVTPNIKDSVKYNNILVGQKEAIRIISKENVKVLGTKNGEKIFKNLISSNTEFAKHFKGDSYRDFIGGIGTANRLMINSKIKVDDTYLKPFIDEVSNRGYRAIMDTEDQFAKSPMILLNLLNEFEIKK